MYWQLYRGAVDYPWFVLKEFVLKGSVLKVVLKVICPGGTYGNSPPVHWWVTVPNCLEVPKARLVVISRIAT